ncbi:Polyamine transporter 1 [Yarrowia sp. B02]|nr:Polyamine transporter 1 [Yarrowia sp. B02]
MTSSNTSEEEYEPQAYYSHASAIDDSEDAEKPRPRANSISTQHSVSSQHLYRRNSHGQVQTLYVSDALVDNPDDPEVLQQEEDGLRLHREVSGMSGKPPSAINEDQVDQQSLYTVSEPSVPTMRRRVGSVVSQLASGSILGPVEEDEIVLPPFGSGKPYPKALGPIEEYTVGFDGPKDPLSPLNWTMKRRCISAVILALDTFAVSWCSSVYSAGMPQLIEEFKVGQVVLLLGVSLFIMGFASGPIVWAPMSELMGRRPPILIGMLGFTLFTFATATAKDLQTVMLTRFFSGFFGAAPLAIVAASYSDMFPASQRGYALAAFTMCVFVAPSLAPMVGGFIAKNPSTGWRWDEYMTGILGAVVTVLTLFLCEETFAPVILANKAAKLRKITGNWGITSLHDQRELDLAEIVNRNVLRPVKMLFTEPTLFLVTLFVAFLYGIMYMALGVYPIIFAEGYGMHQGVAMLTYIGLVIGEAIGCIISMGFEPFYARRGCTPEARLPPMIVGGCCLPLGLFWLTWTGHYHEHIHWIVPTASGLLTGIGFITIFLASINYIVDCYTLFAASAMAANTMMRSSFGAAFPLFTPALFHNLGVNWAGTLVGGIAVLMLPVPILFYMFGKRVRQKSKYNVRAN